ncbi:MAG: type III-B CRISPR module RAMP protein Cmr4 [Caldisericum sp.]|jgi:CRISPR-associated protein Cmr4|nr:type III-B CRISPR module RAMP protein Cmr4 [Caldisericum sp.]
MIQHKIFLIETLTNTCVGSGDVSFGIADITIQKDPVTSLPIFNPSSVKGALREHMEKILTKNEIETIFGSEVDKPGIVKFYEARLLLLPLRSSQKVFYYATSVNALEDFKEALKVFCKEDVSKFDAFINKVKEQLEQKKADFVVFEEAKGLEIEDYEYKDNCKVDIENDTKESVSKILGLPNLSNLAVFNDDIFKRICVNSLPVIARNKIGNDGKSENLFYEEVLPRRSKLWLMLGYHKVEDKKENNASDESKNNNVEDKKVALNKFENSLKNDLIQFGGNASIGYGVTKIKEIDMLCKQQNKNDSPTTEVKNEPGKN